jgi:hypothetical protein
MDDLTCRQHCLKPQHIVSGHAVFHRARTARTFREVSSERAGPAGGRVGGVEEPLSLNRFLKCLRDDSRLGDSLEICRVDFENPVQALERENDSSVNGEGAAGESGPPRAGRDGDPAQCGQ